MSLEGYRYVHIPDRRIGNILSETGKRKWKIEWWEQRERESEREKRMKKTLTN